MASRTRTTTHRHHPKPEVHRYIGLPRHNAWRRVAGRVAYVILFTIGFMVIAQILYPRSMTLPNTTIGGKKYGYRNRLHILQSVNRLNDQKLYLRAGDKVLAYAPGDLGITIDGTANANAVLRYGLKERMVPFSFFFEKRSDDYIAYRIDETKAQQFAAEMKQHDRPPKNAAVKLKGTEVHVRSAQQGYVYQAADVLRTLRELRLTHTLTASLEPAIAEPDISNAVATDAATLLKQRLGMPLTVKTAGVTVRFDKKAIAAWVTVRFDRRSNVFRISYDDRRVTNALARLAKQVYIPAIPGTATLRDGRTISTSGSRPGRALDSRASARAVIAAARENKSHVEVQTVPVVAHSRVVRTYTRSSRGMQALLNYWSQSHGGQYGIVMRQLSGGTIAASVNPHRQFRSASIYKIYIAYVVYTKVNAGQLSMNAKTDTGKTVAACLEVMIVRSDNACGIALGNKIGWGANHSMLRAKGFGATQLVPGAHLTTAQDAATFLAYLQAGALTHSTYDRSLLSMFGRQVWRYGIPAGSAGMHVANKLGTAAGFNNDVAIVYHPRGTYILSVLSYGSSFANIRQLASEVAALMSQ